MRIMMVCATCGSDAILRDAWAEWSEPKQKWILGQTFNHNHCVACDKDCDIKQVVLKPAK